MSGVCWYMAHFLFIDFAIVRGYNLRNIREKFAYSIDTRETVKGENIGSFKRIRGRSDIYYA